MAPDINTMPDSLGNRALPSHSTSNPRSRRPTQITGASLRPRSPPNSSIGHDSSNIPPMRHPRPMTAAELHLELEMEQESLVNVLTRELSSLRAQTASVASNTSNTSSTSAITLDPADTSSNSLTPSTHPTPSRRHRSSSSFSTRSTTSQVPAPAGSTSQASVDRARDAVGIRSRQNSMVLPLRSGAPSPSPSHAQHSQFTEQGTSTYFPALAHRQSVPSVSAAAAVQQSQSGAMPPVNGTSMGRSPSVSASRHEEVVQARQGLDKAKQENEVLVQRIKEMERRLRGQKADPGRGESDTGSGYIGGDKRSGDGQRKDVDGGG